MTASLQYRIIGNSHKAFVVEGFSIKVGRIVVIASYEYNLVVGFIHPLAVAPDDVLIIPLLLKPKAAISSHDE